MALAIDHTHHEQYAGSTAHAQTGKGCRVRNILEASNLASQKFTRKMRRSGDVHIPVAVPLECTECNFSVASQTTNFACACYTNNCTENGLDQG